MFGPQSPNAAIACDEDSDQGQQLGKEERARKAVHRHDGDMSTRKGSRQREASSTNSVTAVFHNAKKGGSQTRYDHMMGQFPKLH